MSDLNSLHNRVCWVDVPVADLDRARAFYAAVLGVPVHKQTFGNYTFCVLDHKDGNGGCLVPGEAEISKQAGILVYFNVNGRIQDAVAQAAKLGGAVLQPIHSIGPHGFRALVLDCEGNRIALHSVADA